MMSFQKRHTKTKSVHHYDVLGSLLLVKLCLVLFISASTSTSTLLQIQVPFYCTAFTTTTTTSISRRYSVHSKYRMDEEEESRKRIIYSNSQISQINRMMQKRSQKSSLISLRSTSSKHDESLNPSFQSDHFQKTRKEQIESDSDVISSGNNHSKSNNDTKKTNRKSNLSPAAQWHRKRRAEMLSKYASQITPLEQQSHGLYVGLPLLLLSNLSLATMAVMSSKLSILQIAVLAFFPGSMFSLWQLQISHDCLHGSLLPTSKHLTATTQNNNNGIKKYRTTIHDKTINWIIRHRTKLHKYILFWGSMPSAFGYYLYLQYGHLTHHTSLGDETKSNLKTLFDSHNKNFEDGDALFVAHRMKLKGEVGPTFYWNVPKFYMNFRNWRRNGMWMGQKQKDDTTQSQSQLQSPIQEMEDQSRKITMSISKSGFSLWKENQPLRNAIAFTSSFLFERILLTFNDVVVSLTGRNYFFPNKPKSFHREVALYCRCAVAVRLGLCLIGQSWKALFFLYLAETLWTIPPHPACAMFITNHGSGSSDNSGDGDGDGESSSCIPSSSTYAGKLYSLFTLGTNYHVEHHDFPNIPLHKLGKLRQIAPEFYGGDEKDMNKDNVFAIMKKTFSKPEFYACMDAGIQFD